MKPDTSISNKQPDSVSAGPRLDRLPIGAFHYRVLFLIAGGVFFDTFDINLAGSVAGGMLKEGFSTLPQNAAFFSSTFLGMLLGALCVGYVADRYGRRFFYRFNLAVIGVSTIACAFAPDMQWMTSLRFLTGLGLGAEGALAYAALAEFVPPSSRGRWAAMLALLGNSSILLASFLGFLLVPSGDWRAMFLIAGSGALVFFVLRFWLPESPRWLEAVGRTREAEALLTKIESGVAHGLPLPAFSPGVRHREMKPGFGVLFTAPVWRQTVIAALAWFVLTFSIFGFIVWLPSLLVSKGLTVGSALGLTTIMSFGGPVGAGIGFLLVDRMGRRTGTMAICVAVAALSAAFAFSFSYYASAFLLSAFGFLLVTGMYLLATVTCATYVPELFTTQLRVRGTAFGNAVGRLAGIAAPYLILVLFNIGGLVAVIAGIIGLVLLLALIVYLFGVETRKLSLEAIDMKLQEGASTER